MRTTTRTCDWCGGAPTGPPGWITVEDAGLPPMQGRCVGRADLCSWGHVAELGAAMARLMAVEDEYAPRLASLASPDWGSRDVERSETWADYRAALNADEDIARAHRLMARHGGYLTPRSPAEAIH